MPTDANPLPRQPEPERPDIEVVVCYTDVAPYGPFWEAIQAPSPRKPGKYPHRFRLPGTRTLREREERRAKMIVGLRNLIAAPTTPEPWKRQFENIIAELRGEA